MSVLSAISISSSQEIAFDSIEPSLADIASASSDSAESRDLRLNPDESELRNDLVDFLLLREESDDTLELRTCVFGVFLSVLRNEGLLGLPFFAKLASGGGTKPPDEPEEAENAPDGRLFDTTEVGRDLVRLIVSSRAASEAELTFFAFFRSFFSSRHLCIQSMSLFDTPRSSSRSPCASGSVWTSASVIFWCVI